jgi:hypothetical protein
MKPKLHNKYDRKNFAAIKNAYNTEGCQCGCRQNSLRNFCYSERIKKSKSQNNFERNVAQKYRKK